MRDVITCEAIHVDLSWGKHGHENSQLDLSCISRLSRCTDTVKTEANSQLFNLFYLFDGIYRAISQVSAVYLYDM